MPGCRRYGAGLKEETLRAGRRGCCQRRTRRLRPSRADAPAPGKMISKSPESLRSSQRLWGSSACTHRLDVSERAVALHDELTVGRHHLAVQSVYWLSIIAVGFFALSYSCNDVIGIDPYGTQHLTLIRLEIRMLREANGEKDMQVGGVRRAVLKGTRGFGSLINMEMDGGWETLLGCPASCQDSAAASGNYRGSAR